MALGPNKPCVDYLCLVEAFYFLQQQCQQFFTVSIAYNPWWSHVSMTKSAEIDNSLFRDTDGDIGLGNGTG